MGHMGVPVRQCRGAAPAAGATYHTSSFTVGMMAGHAHGGNRGIPDTPNYFCAHMQYFIRIPDTKY